MTRDNWWENQQPPTTNGSKMVDGFKSGAVGGGLDSQSKDMNTLSSNKRDEDFSNKNIIKSYEQEALLRKSQKTVKNGDLNSRQSQKAFNSS